VPTAGHHRLRAEALALCDEPAGLPATSSTTNPVRYAPAPSMLESAMAMLRENISHERQARVLLVKVHSE
jgi:hypothetical protein